MLASQSPRRRELLAGLGLCFEVIPAALEEPPPGETPPEEYVKTLALAKARKVAGRASGEAILAADTVVVLEGEILGKPKDFDEARQMLSALSGRTHQVFTGYTILSQRDESQRDEIIRAVRTEVVMKPLSPEEIEAYLATGEPMDKAGAYAIQGLASYMVQEVRGSVTNVIGLPLTEVVTDLLKLRLIAWGHAKY